MLRPVQINQQNILGSEKVLFKNFYEPSAAKFRSCKRLVTCSTLAESTRVVRVALCFEV